MFKRSIALVFVLISLVVSGNARAAPTLQPTRASDPTYSYVPHYLGRMVRHRGDLLGVRWTAHRSGTAPGIHTLPVMVKITLVGPYTSVNALKSDYGKRHIAHGVAVSSHWTTDRNHRPMVMYLKVPKQAKRGYYDLETLVVYASSQAGGATVIRVK